MSGTGADRRPRSEALSALPADPTEAQARALRGPDHADLGHPESADDITEDLRPQP